MNNTKTIVLITLFNVLIFIAHVCYSCYYSKSIKEYCKDEANVLIAERDAQLLNEYKLILYPLYDEIGLSYNKEANTLKEVFNPLIYSFENFPDNDSK